MGLNKALIKALNMEKTDLNFGGPMAYPMSVEAHIARAKMAANAAGFSLDDGVIYGTKGARRLDANMCGQAFYGNPSLVCRKESGSISCRTHSLQPRRNLIEFGQIYSRTVCDGFTVFENVKTIEMINLYLILGSDPEFPDMPCFRIPDVKGGPLYAISKENFIIRLQEGDVIVKAFIEYTYGPRRPNYDRCAYVLVRTTPEGKRKLVGSGHCHS